jgi:hypothetical protein
VVDDVEVVVEEQERQRPPVLDDDGPPPRLLVRLVLEEGPDLEQRQPDIGRQK